MRLITIISTVIPLCLAGAGPAEGDSDPRGFDAAQAGSLVMELHPWYGSAALINVDEIHASIAKASP